MTLAHLRTKHLLLIACPALAMAVGPDANAARAHVHGQGTLDIVVDSGRVELTLIAPDADIKESADDTAAALEARFGNPGLFTFTGAQCQLQSMSAGPAEDLEISWFEDAEDAKRAVEELVKERDELKHTKEALECLIKNQKSVLDELDVQVEYRDLNANYEHRKTLREQTGRTMVPCLFIDGAPMFESADIIEWLRETFPR